MVNWFCFKFWFCFRLLLASIAHFNWFTAIYVNCIYFTLWKTFDILWFWAHLGLCACFPALRPENYLLVFIRIFRAKRGEHAGKSNKEIYELLYKGGSDKTDAERELKRIETLRKDRRERRLQGGGLSPTRQQGKEAESSTGSEEEEDGIQQGQESKGIYPSLEEEQPMPNIRVDRTRQVGERGKAEAQGLVRHGEEPDRPGKWRRLIPGFLRKSANLTAEEQENRKAVREKRDLEKQHRREEHAQKLLEKKERREKRRKAMAHLRERAREERRRKNFADAIDLLLTYCRLITSFAVMVGHIHKTFLPRYLAPPIENVYDSPDLLMVFTVTLLLDVGFFWLLVLWSLCKQLALCCRLGPFRFLFWCAGLFLLGSSMLYPMHFVHEQLDGTWCLFEEGEPLSQYFDG